MPRPSNAVFDPSLASAFTSTRSYFANRSVVVTIVEGLHAPRDSRDGASKQNHSLAPAKMGPTRKTSVALCMQVLSIGPRRLFDCKSVPRYAPDRLVLS